MTIAKFNIKINVLLFIILCSLPVFGHTEQEATDSITNEKIRVLENKISELENQNNNLEYKLKNSETTGFVVFFIGVFCAYWAQNSGRNAWVWFFCGVFFNVITLIVLLIKNKQDLLFDE